MSDTAPSRRIVDPGPVRGTGTFPVRALAVVLADAT